MFWMSALSDVSFVDIFPPVLVLPPGSYYLGVIIGGNTWGINTPGWCSHSLGVAFCRAEIFNFSQVQLINCFFHGLCL